VDVVRRAEKNIVAIVLNDRDRWVGLLIWIRPIGVP